MDDAQLLQSYVETSSSEAFTALTNKHVNFVYGAALRLVRDRHVAEEVTQAVFIVLARKAATLRHEAVLSSWLLSTTRYAALGQMKINARRKRHERRAAEMAKTEWHEDAEKSWPQYEGELDGALASLRETDRKAVLLRFYEHKRFDEIAAILGRSPMAVRQLASRARRRVQGLTTASNTDLARQREVVDAFLAAARGGDFAALLAVLDPEVVVRADPAAVRAGAAREVRGAAAVAETFAGRARVAQPALVDGAVGAVWAPGGRPRVVFGFTITGGRIVAIDILADPARLHQLALVVLTD